MVTGFSEEEFAKIVRAREERLRADWVEAKVRFAEATLKAQHDTRQAIIHLVLARVAMGAAS